MPKEFESLNKIIGALFTTKPSKILKSDLALSRAAGLPYDRNRIELFETLSNYLHNKTFKERSEKNTSLNSFRNCIYK